MLAAIRIESPTRNRMSELEKLLRLELNAAREHGEQRSIDQRQAALDLHLSEDRIAALEAELRKSERDRDAEVAALQRDLAAESGHCRKQSEMRQTAEKERDDLRAELSGEQAHHRNTRSILDMERECRVREIADNAALRAQVRDLAEDLAEMAREKKVFGDAAERGKEEAAELRAKLEESIECEARSNGNFAAIANGFGLEVWSEEEIVEMVKELRAKITESEAYADKLAAGLPMLPADIENLRNANFQFVKENEELRGRVNAVRALIAECKAEPDNSDGTVLIHYLEKALALCRPEEA